MFPIVCSNNVSTVCTFIVVGAYAFWVCFLIDLHNPRIKAHIPELWFLSSWCTENVFRLWPNYSQTGHLGGNHNHLTAHHQFSTSVCQFYSVSDIIRGHASNECIMYVTDHESGSTVTTILIRPRWRRTKIWPLLVIWRGVKKLRLNSRKQKENLICATSKT